MIRLIRQDLTGILANREFPVFLHGCNCFGAMGAGIARTVKNLYPEALKADIATGKGNRAKLGTICPVQVGERNWIINAYTQYDFWSEGPRADYAAIGRAMKATAAFMADHGFDHILMPKVGAGLAGGDWNRIEAIIRESFPSETAIDIYYL